MPFVAAYALQRARAGKLPAPPQKIFARCEELVQVEYPRKILACCEDLVRVQYLKIIATKNRPACAL